MKPLDLEAIRKRAAIQPWTALERSAQVDVFHLLKEVERLRDVTEQCATMAENFLAWCEKGVRWEATEAETDEVRRVVRIARAALAKDGQ